MKMSAPRAVGELLLGALPQISDRLLEVRLRHAWASIVGRDAARRARPDGFSGGVLRVVVDNSPWLHELTLRSSELTAKVRERFPEITALRFTLGAITAETQDDVPSPPPRALPLSPADHADIDAAAAAIADASL